MKPGKRAISVVGASGFIGRGLYGHLQETLNGKYDIIGTGNRHNPQGRLVRLDVTDRKAVEAHLTRYEPAFLILAAGMKDVRLCESDPDTAYRLNAGPPKTIADAILELGLDTKVLFFSSDYVFRGDRGHYQDCDAPDPGTVYGKSKLAGERALLASGISCKVLRISAVMGNGGTFFDWLVKELTTKDELRMFDDVYFSPTPVNFLNAVVAHAITDYGVLDRDVLHVAGERRLSRYEFACMVRSYLKSKVRIVPDTCDLQTMQRDLSLVPSAILEQWREHGFEDYLKLYIENEVRYDPDDRKLL